MSITTDNIRVLERAWNRYQALTREPLDEPLRSTYDYAIRLAALKTLDLGNGLRVDIEPYIAESRAELYNFMCAIALSDLKYTDQDAHNCPGTIAWTGAWSKRDLIDAYPRVLERLNRTIDKISSEIPDVRAALEQSLRQKKLVLCLGGGGGTGFVHLCLFEWLEEAGIQPSLITGTSIGSLLGCVRAMQTQYDAAKTRALLPSWRKIVSCLQPSLGGGKHGLRGIFKADFSSLILEFAQAFGWSSMPSFRELKIPFACTSSGILLRSDVQKALEKQKRGIIRSAIQMTTGPLVHAFEHAACIAGIVSNSNAAIPVSFGLDELTRNMPVADAISFSILIPSVLTHEIPRNHYQSRETMAAVFQRDGLYRLCDGGVASNVPVRTACEAMPVALNGCENVYILGLDVFAPQSGDPLFYPLQLIANKNALVDATYADAFVRLRDLLSPVDLSPSNMRLRWLNTRFRKAFADEMKIIEYAMRELHPMRNGLGNRE